MAVLTVDVKDQAGVRRISLKGAIDDRVDYVKLGALAAPVMVFDFDKVESINSYGIKGWINLIKTFEKSKVIYEKCPIVFIESVNLITQLRKGARVQSFYLPFGCRSCDNEVPKLVTREEATAPGFVEGLNARFPCDSCERQLEFQDDETVYFDFLKE